jgi:hypothetical protein
MEREMKEGTVEMSAAARRPAPAWRAGGASSRSAQWPLGLCRGLLGCEAHPGIGPAGSRHPGARPAVWNAPAAQRSASAASPQGSSPNAAAQRTARGPPSLLASLTSPYADREQKAEKTGAVNTHTCAVAGGQVEGRAGRLPRPKLVCGAGAGSWSGGWSAAVGLLGARSCWRWSIGLSPRCAQVPGAGAAAWRCRQPAAAARQPLAAAARSLWHRHISASGAARTSWTWRGMLMKCSSLYARPAVKMRPCGGGSSAWPQQPQRACPRRDRLACGLLAGPRHSGARSHAAAPGPPSAIQACR